MVSNVSRICGPDLWHPLDACVLVRDNQSEDPVLWALACLEFLLVLGVAAINGDVPDGGFTLRQLFLQRRFGIKQGNTVCTLRLRCMQPVP